MDPVTAISLASAIITLVDFGAKVLHRFEEISKDGGLPKSFRGISTRMPLLISMVNRTRDAASRMGKESEAVLLPVIESCQEQITELDRLLERVTSSQNEHSWRKGIKAAISVMEEARVQKIEATLRENVQMLASYNAKGIDVQARPETSALWMVSFERDEDFIERPDIFALIGDTLKNHNRVCLAGIGGVGYVPSTA